MARRRTKKQSTAIPAVEQFLKKIELLDRDNLPNNSISSTSGVPRRSGRRWRRGGRCSFGGSLEWGRHSWQRRQPRCGRPLVRQVVEPRTESRDLLWTFNALMRLADAQVAAAFSPGIRAAKETEEGTVVAEIPESLKQKLRAQLDVANYVRPGPLWWAFDWGDAKKQAVRSDTPEPVLDRGPTRTRAPSCSSTRSTRPMPTSPTAFLRPRLGPVHTARAAQDRSRSWGNLRSW